MASVCISVSRQCPPRGLSLTMSRVYSIPNCSHTFSKLLQGLLHDGRVFAWCSKISLGSQLALIMLENVHWEFRRSSTGQAGRVAIQNLQVDNQLLTAAQPVILAKAFQVHTAFFTQRPPAQCSGSAHNMR